MNDGSESNDAAVGVLLVSAEDATIGEWQPRRVEELRRLELPITEAVEHELVGPAASHPRGSGERATAARSSNQRDLWERRMEEHRIRFTRSAADNAAKIAKRRGWDLVLVLGDPRRTGPACEQLNRARLHAVPIDNVLDWMRPAALAKRLAPEVARARAATAKRSSRRSL